jgi:membrane protein DedA with SNARE-associated domain
MRWRRFLVFNALGAALWVGTWVSLGYLAGNHIGTIYEYITRYSYYAVIAAVVLLAGYITRRVLRRRRRTARQDREPAGNQPAGPSRAQAERPKRGNLPG